MKQRGISPLIATVLIVGITIAIAALFWIWGRETLSDSEKALYIEAGKGICATQVEIDVSDCALDGATSLVIENKGSVPITFFKFRQGEEAVTHEEELPVGETRTLMNDAVTEDTEVFPGIVTEEGFPVVCADQSVSC